jgi:hypothetical protein
MGLQGQSLFVTVRIFICYKIAMKCDLCGFRSLPLNAKEESTTRMKNNFYHAGFNQLNIYTIQIECKIGFV